MSHVLVAGATGVVGSRVVPLLLEAGHRVTALVRGPRELPEGVGSVTADVLDAAAVHAAVAAARPDVVMHQLTDLGARDLAANSRMRVVGTRNLVDAALAAGVRRIVAQSIAWAYGPGERPAREDEPLDVGAAPPRDATIAGVVALESAVAELPEAVVLRYGTLHGPGTWYADGAIAGTLVADDSVTSFLHVDDAATAAVAALGWPSGPVNVCDDEPVAASVWVPAFCRAVGAPPPPVATGRPGWARGADNTHARADLGWRPAVQGFVNGSCSASSFSSRA
jgi:nucleoside-diphosphate-sugar epimerase